MSDISLKFLSAVWRLQSADGHAFLSLKRKESGKWQDIPVPVDRQTGPFAADPPNSDKGDIYFTPCLFSEPRRLNDLALPSRLLYADLDEVDPRSLALRPTAAWQSSPARFQALWVLDKRLPPELFAQLNQALTYSIDADKGGWHQSKVLRLPGTRNYKYRGRPLVKLMWFTKQRYAPQSLADALKAQPGSGAPSPASKPAREPSALPKSTPSALIKRYRTKLPRRARRLLSVKTPTASEDRSARLWEIHNHCLKAGMSAQETFIVSQACAYNKYKGQRREKRMLWAEIQKAQAQQKKESAAAGKFYPGIERRSPKKPPPDTRAELSAEAKRSRKAASSKRPSQSTKPSKAKSRASRPGSRNFSGKASSNPRSNDYVVDESGGKPPDPIKPLKTVNLLKFLGSNARSPSWLVESIWGRSAQGIWAGEFKAYKSTLLLDLAISVASGKPFLGKFPVRRTGPVIFIQEENSVGFMQDRGHRILQSKDLGIKLNGKQPNPTIQFGPNVSVELYSLTGFRLTNEQDMLSLNAWCNLNKPALVILDPLYRMAPEVDEKDSATMAPLLSNLSKISSENDCALILAHHYNQPTADNKALRSGYRISGTSVFARWFESSVYVERKGEEGDYSVKFHTEHREHASSSPHVITLDLDPNDPDTYAIDLIQEDDDSGSGNGRGSRAASDPRPHGKVRLLSAIKRELGLSSSVAAKMLKEEGYRIVRREVDGKSRIVVIPPRT